MTNPNATPLLGKISVNLIFLIALLTLVTIDFISSKEIKALVKANTWVIHTHQAIQNTNDTLYNITNAESQQRGYLITGDKKFLKNFNNTISNTKTSLTELANITRYNQEQQTRIKTLNALLTKKINYLNQLIQLKEHHKLATPDTLQVFTKNQELSDEIRDTLTTIKNTEFALLHTRNIIAVENARLTDLIVTGGNVASELFLLISIMLFNLELTRRVKAERKNNEVEKEAYEKLNQSMQELQCRNQQITLLVEMNEIMLACSSVEELSKVIASYCEKILHFTHGVLYMMHPSRNYLETIASWGTISSSQKTTFTYDECWALRLGRMHESSSTFSELACQHLSNDERSIPYLCAPLMAQNDIMGLLYIETQHSLTKDETLLIHAISEQAALSLANVRLKENLQFQSVRDPLTGLYNRRYLEEFMQKEVSRAKRSHTPLAVFVLDLDHFKRFNDSYGHEGGNIVLREVGQLLQKEIRSGDIAARYGGEEFILVLYNTNFENAKKRAEHIRHLISQLQLRYGAQELGATSASIGVAVFPGDGDTPLALIEAADRALYQAKKTGRNKVVANSEMLEASV